METKAIQTINLAVTVLRQFVDLSVELLPKLDKLTRKNNLTPDMKAEKEKIDSIYGDYDVKPETSELLMDSNIIGLIQNSYQSIKNRKGKKDEKINYYLDEIDKEYRKLIANWNYTLMN